LKGINGQINSTNFQTGIPNIDLNTLGSISGSLNLGMPNNVLADISGLEALNTSANPALANLANLPGM
jgi:hypothetical protein